MKDMIPPAMIAAALIVYLTGALDRPGFEGAGEGLAIGALISGAIWIAMLWRRSRETRRDAD